MLERLLSGFYRPKVVYPKHFDTIVSLGFNCEVSFRIQDHLNGHLDSYPFSWCYVYGTANLPWCMEHMEEMLSGEIQPLSNGMLLCKRCNLAFHVKKAVQYLPDGTVDPVTLETAVTELKSRLKHMQEKLCRLLQGERTTLFVVKNAKLAIDWDSAIEEISELALWLEQHYKGGRYLLVVVVERQCYSNRLRRLENDHLTFRAVTEFAKEGKAQSGGDHAGWQAIFDEFDYDKHALSGACR